MDETKLCGVEQNINWVMCGVRLVDRVSTDVLHDMMGVVVKIKDMLIQSHL